MLQNWLHRILRHEATPPQDAWKNITNELDKEDTTAVDLKDKILNHSQTPPSFILNNIFAELDKEAQPAFVDKIKNYTQVPPAGAWQNIVDKVDAEDKKVIPFNRTTKNLRPLYISIAAAAAVVAVVLITVLPNNKTATDNSETASAKQEEKAITTDKNISPVVITDTNKTVKKDIAVAPVKQIPEQQLIPDLTVDYIKGNEVHDLATNPNLLQKEKLQDATGQTPMDIALLNAPNTYISITGADGETVKVSSKFANLISLFNNSSDTKETLDVIIEESAKWKATIAAWRSKMTNNTVAPSLSNFMDILELSSILEEKK